MSFALLILGCIALYLTIEERERRKDNPGGAPWSTRLKKSVRANLHYIIGGWIAFALYFVGMRKASLGSCATEAVLMTCVFVFLVFHEATLSLPRKER